MNSKKTKTLILGVFLFSSLITALIANKFLPDFPWADQREYDEIATTLLETGRYPLINGAVLSPGYPLFITAVFFVFGHDYDAVYLIQYLLLGVIAWLMFRIGREHFNLPFAYALVLSLTVLFWPYLLLYAGLMLTEIFYILLLTAFIYFLLKFRTAQERKYVLFAAALLALAALVRPIPLFLPIWLVIAYLAIYKLSKTPIEKKFIARALISLFVFFSLVAPWIIYSSVRKGEIVPVTGSATGILHTHWREMGYEWGAFKTPGYEPGAEIMLKKVLLIRLKNIYRFWLSGASGYQADLLTEKYPPAKYLIGIYQIFYYILIALAFASWLFIKKEKKIILPWLIISYFWLFHIVLHTSPRFTLPIIPLVILLAFYSLYRVKKRFKSEPLTG